jgi:phage shock protein A
MESEVDLVDYGRKSTLDEEFDTLMTDDDVEKELEILKSSRSKNKARSEQ